ncbi:MAG TPA: ABC-type transport auxiliary lipoprotein family protein [Stellaceae bacterium]|jgi:cholesterol transport system auxiliary component|nr:ABC-type transport auxiliary lipoprotein family protein [Stellaceae bacterium]
MTHPSRRLVIAALALAPAGCSSLLGGGGPSATLYTLTALTDFPAGPHFKLQVLFDRPTASDALNTTRIALRRNVLTVDYFADAAWTDSAPSMIQSLLVDSLQSSGRVTAASRDTLAIRGDVEVRIDVRHFEADYRSGQELPTVRVELGLILVRVEDRSILATDTVTASAQPTKNEVSAIVVAFNQALQAAMRETLAWTLAHARAP